MNNAFVPEIFGRLTTLDSGHMVTFGSCKRKCHMVRCVCGTEKRVIRCHLVAGRTKSCGCLNREAARLANTIHGHCKGGERTPEYRAYENMLDRCLNPNHKQYADWGGRGINVHPEWLGPGGFERWLAHIGPMPVSGLTQDRFPDPNGNYEPGNVRWATTEQQANNRRNNINLELQGTTKTLAQWAKHVGINESTLRNRLRLGWSIVDALTKSTRKLTHHTPENP